MKGNRQEKILQIINEQIILTQDELQEALEKQGYHVTQSTISRDIKRLRLVKSHDLQGNYRYISAANQVDSEHNIEQYREIFSKSVISVDYALNNIVIKCYNGMASSVCVAVDSVFGNRMLGTIAGDDTIFIIARSTEDARSLAEELKTYF